MDLHNSKVSALLGCCRYLNQKSQYSHSIYNSVMCIYNSVMSDMSLFHVHFKTLMQAFLDVHRHKLGGKPTLPKT